MDNSWQQMKCSSTWPTQPSLTPSPPLPPLQLPSSSAYRNQMDVNVGHHLHPYIAQRACLSEHAIVPEPLVFSTLNLGSYKLDKPEVGNSFLALLSGPSQQLEYDFQQLLNPKAPVSKLPLHNTNFEVSSNGFGVPGTRIAPFPQLLNGESIGSVVEFCPDITSRLLPASSYGGVAILRSNLDSPNLNLHGTGADSAKQVLQRSVHRNDMEMEVSSLRLGRLAGAGFTNGNQHHTMNIQTSPKLPSEVESASLVLPSAFARGKPRVFCSGTSGDLLFSDTGFLGVVCSCHGLPMSVAKFCEHAGSCAINPGDAVRLETGETIAQWCRGCFLKFGKQYDSLSTVQLGKMRVPDDVNGWDWPNGIMAPGALVKGKSTTMSNMPKHSDSFGGSINSGQSWNGFLSPNNFYRGQDVLEKSVNKVLCNGQQSNSMERHKVVHNGQQSNYMERHIVQKSFAGTSQSILPSLTGNQMLQAARESSSSMSKTALDKGRKSNWYPSIDIVSKSGSPFIADPSCRFSKYFGTATNVSSCNNLREAFVMDVDGAVPSNIELRLGQPSQQSNTLGDSTLPPVRPLSFESPFDIPKSRFCEPLVHNALNPRVTDELRQNLVCAPSVISDSNGREENSELDLVRHALRSLNAMDPAKLEQLKGDVTKSSQISTFLSHFINPTEADMQSHVPKHTDNTVSNGEHCMPKVIGGDSQIAKFDPADFPRNMTDGLNGKLNTNELVHSNFMDKGKWSRTLSDNCHVVAKSDTLFRNKQMADSDPFAKDVGLNGKLNTNELVHSNFMDKGKWSRTLSDNCHVVEKSDTLFRNKQMADSDPFAKDVNENCLQSSSAVHDKISGTNLHQLAVTLADAADARNSSHQFWKTPCLEGAEHLDQVLKSVRSGTASGIAVSGLSTSAVPFGSFSSPNIINLSKKKSSDVSQHLLDENRSLLALKHLLELSEQKNSTASLEINAEQGRAYCTSDTEMRRKNLKEDLITSLELRDGSSFTNRQDAAVDAARSLQSFCNHYSNDGHEKSGERNCFNFSNLKQKMALCSNELGALVLPFHAHGADDQPSLRLGRIGNEDTTDSREHERCRQKDLNSYLPGNCGCAVRSTCLTRSCICIGTTSINASKHTECVGVKAPAMFGKDNRILKDQRVLLSWDDGLKGHSSQWRDVPSKVTGNCISTLIERPAEELDGKEPFEDQLADTAAKGFGRMSDGTESLKEQQMSNVCSRLSPAVTEVSVGVNNADFCTMDDGDGRYARDLVIDEGSGIEKCSSSDDPLESERWAETLTVLGKTASITEWCSSKLPRKPSCDLVDEFQLKESRSLIQTGCTVQEHTNCTCQLEHGPKAEKGRRKTKWKSLDAAFPASCISPVHDDPSDCTQHSELYIHLSKEMENSLCDDHAAKKRCCIYTCGSSSLKRKRSAVSSTKSLPRKRNLHGSEDYHREWGDDYQTQLSSDSYFNRIPKPKIAAEKKVKRDWTADLKRQFSGKDGNHVDAGKVPKCKSLGCEKNLSCHVDTHKKARPVVCGNLGIITNGKLAHGIKKPAKIISLRSILKVAKRCIVTENDVELTNACLGGNNEGCHDEVSFLKKESDNGTHKTLEENKAKPRLSSMLETMKKSFCQSEGYGELSILKKDRGAGGQKSAKLGSIHHCSSIQMRQKYKETRMRSLYELTEKGKSGEKPGLSDLVGNDHSQIVKAGLRLKAFSRSALVNALRVKHHSSTKFCSRRNSKRSVQTYFLKEKSHLQIGGDNQDDPVDLSLPNAKRSSIKESRSNAFVKDFDIFCCVCGSSNNDEFNRLLECSCCLIRVHQACYGVSKAPKDCWCCRPCRTNSKNIACVLCGYKGGAMTRALKSQNIVKGLLDAWKGGVEEAAYGNSVALSDAAQDHLGSLDPIIKGGTSRPEELESVSLTRTMIEPLSSDVLDANSESVIVMNTYRSLRNIQVQNTITAGVLDPTITQWVHVVCGLWTPGTRCPNVNTMSTFDVSGASRPKKNMACSICSRPGGSCIQCRLPNCSVHFHPWCAHQKGLLQSEIEGVDNDKVGFYGRCLLHATNIGCHTSDHPIDQKEESPKEKDFTCARTEGYKGRKRGEGFRRNFHLNADHSKGCLVSQEQINAWLHINGQKCIRGHVQPQASEIEHDCRKEYTRYKQSQGWRHLVVYKSVIHALGLYTSQFISRGAMVVEYVGEIVGLRVADKREIEYQSGRKVQYKSACYFFRIDKEHIIDATRKGGIARFVNHSCLPNCVAKVISVRNEKKVVFFAERDINPGEEITYDYHFNHEDEGKKIPCFCNSKNCRRYLN